jgi:hypothetical protein
MLELSAMRDYVSKAVVDLELGESFTEHRKSFYNKARGWLKMKPREWKSWKWQRLKSFGLGTAIDHMLQTSCGWPGLSRFAVDPDPTKRPPNSLTWPSLSCAVDQGSDNVCLLNFLVRKLHLLVGTVWDFSHGCWNDLKLSVKRAGLWSHWLLYMCSRNMRFGPWLQEARFMQVREAAKTYFSIASPKTCPYFQHSVPGLLRDRDQEWRIGEPNLVEALWDDAKTADA